MNNSVTSGKFTNKIEKLQGLIYDPNDNDEIYFTGGSDDESDGGTVLHKDR